MVHKKQELKILLFLLHYYITFLELQTTDKGFWLRFATPRQLVNETTSEAAATCSLKTVGHRPTCGLVVCEAAEKHQFPSCSCSHLNEKFIYHSSQAPFGFFSIYAPIEPSLSMVNDEYTEGPGHNDTGSCHVSPSS